MLPDFRFAIGAVLAITMLGVTGFGLAMSVQLMHEARVGSFDASRSLAFADSTDRNQFYDADAARRFQGLDGKVDDLKLDDPKVDDPGADVPLDPAAIPSPVVALATPDDQTASLATSDAGAGHAPATDSPPMAAGAATPDEPAAGPPNAVEAKPDATESVASAPATPVSAARLDGGGPPAPPIAGIVPLPPNPAKPVVHARPRRRRLVVRTHVVPPAPPPTTYSDSGFSTTNGQWPSADGGFNTTPTAKKARIRLTGSLPGR
jgi:hypothetical protein